MPGEWSRRRSSRRRPRSRRRRRRSGSRTAWSASWRGSAGRRTSARRGSWLGAQDRRGAARTAASPASWETPSPRARLRRCRRTRPSSSRARSRRRPDRRPARSGGKELEEAAAEGTPTGRTPSRNRRIGRTGSGSRANGTAVIGEIATTTTTMLGTRRMTRGGLAIGTRVEMVEQARQTLHRMRGLAASEVQRRRTMRQRRTPWRSGTCRTCQLPTQTAGLTSGP
mmetsp:Transcript_14207/g.40678  ORF Transcript_14207/g.40678 Transcript_14207/m.40678 type:complete len:226 (+) Transcript_14207:456-1133(+)